jgi:hypothetical protein
MHGIIFQQLQQYVIKNYGSSGWISLLAEAGLGGKVFMPTQVYPDSEVVAIVTKASEVTKTPVPAILESFGEFIAPSLLKIYSSSLNKDWSTIDLLEHVENTIHKAVRFADKSADPPELTCLRISKQVVSIQYSSHRKMIDVGIGIIKAVAKTKNEKVDILRVDSEKGTSLTVRLV